MIGSAKAFSALLQIMQYSSSIRKFDLFLCVLIKRRAGFLCLSSESKVPPEPRDARPQVQQLWEGHPEESQCSNPHYLFQRLLGNFDNERRKKVTSITKQSAGHIIRKLGQVYFLYGQGRTVREICRETRVSDSTYCKWRKEYRRDGD